MSRCRSLVGLHLPDELSELLWNEERHGLVDLDYERFGGVNDRALMNQTKPLISAGRAAAASGEWLLRTREW